MTTKVSKTQSDRLGDRLKKGNISEADLRLLDTYRRSFTKAYEVVIVTIQQELELEPTGRPAKSTTSISEKLRRDTIRLTQIQDIAGCRLVVLDIVTQDSVTQSLSNLFEDITIVDRRQHPSYGYRAVHVIVKCYGKLIKIQVRTMLQHLWAELSEKFSDVVDPAIKYGGSDKDPQEALMVLHTASIAIAREESYETELAGVYESLISADQLIDEKQQQIAEIQSDLSSLRQKMYVYFSNIIKRLEETEG